MKLKKLALCVALATGAATTAQAADTLFFPYIVSGDAVLTLVSVINADVAPGAAQYYNFNGTDEGGYSSTNYKYLHWRYHYKIANTADAECKDLNGYFPTSPLDITTYNVSGKGGVVLNGQPTGVMFNDPSVNNNWASATVSNLNRWNAITLSGQRAVLFVHNANSTADGPFLAGEALVFEFGTGAAWGYRADVNTSAGVSADADFDFSGIGPIDSFFSLMPANEVVTRFFITPVNDPDVDQEDGEASDTILLGGGVDTDWYGLLTTEIDLADFGNGFKVWDRDEGGISGGVEPKIVTCVWKVDAVGAKGGDGLIVGGPQRAYVDTQGGWAELISRRPLGVDYPTENAAAIKLEFRPAGITGGSLPATLGAANNAYRLNPYVQAVDNTPAP